MQCGQASSVHSFTQWSLNLLTSSWQSEPRQLDWGYLSYSHSKWFDSLHREKDNILNTVFLFPWIKIAHQTETALKCKSELNSLALGTAPHLLSFSLTSLVGFSFSPSYLLYIAGSPTIYYWACSLHILAALVRTVVMHKDCGKTLRYLRPVHNMPNRVCNMSQPFTRIGFCSILA